MHPEPGHPVPAARQAPPPPTWLAALLGLAAALVLTEEVAYLRASGPWLRLAASILAAVPLAVWTQRQVVPWARARYEVTERPTGRWVLGCAAIAAILVVVFPSRSRAIVAIAQALCLTIVVYALAPAVIRGPRSIATPVGRWEGLDYSLPPVLVWLVWLVIFFPGIMSADSTDQWAQAGLGRLNDFHPVVHTALVRLLRWVWDSPAIVALFQILGIGALVGWGLRELRLSGLSRTGAWISSGLLAVLPVYSTMAITLWKDIPFGAALLGLTILLFRIAAGRPLGALQWGLVVALAGFASVLRHNGAPIVLGLMAALFLLLPKRQRWASVAVGVASVLIALGVRQAVIKNFPVTRFTPEIALIGVLGSHVAHGTPMSDAERVILDDIHPVESKWAYSCFSNVPTIWGSGDFDWAAFRRHAPVMRALAVDLTLRDPRPTLSHIRCASSMIWEIFPRGAPLTGIGFNVHPDGSVSTIVKAAGVPPSAPPSEQLLKLAATGVQHSLRPKLAWVIWRPALASWLLLLGCLAACLRSGNWRLMAVLLPLLVHTGALGLVITAPDVRYQYGGLLLAALFGVGFFLGVRVKDDQADRDQTPASTAEPTGQARSQSAG